jgi:hypothetical protein
MLSLNATAVAPSRIHTCRRMLLLYLNTSSMGGTTRPDQVAKSGVRPGSSAGPRAAALSANRDGADPGMARTNCAPLEAAQGDAEPGGEAEELIGTPQNGMSRAAAWSRSETHDSCRSADRPAAVRSGPSRSRKGLQLPARAVCVRGTGESNKAESDGRS